MVVVVSRDYGGRCCSAGGEFLRLMVVVGGSGQLRSMVLRWLWQVLIKIGGYVWWLWVKGDGS